MVCQFPHSPSLLFVFRHCKHGFLVLALAMTWKWVPVPSPTTRLRTCHQMNSVFLGLGTSHQTVLSAVYLLQQWSYALKLIVAWLRFTLLLGYIFLTFDLVLWLLWHFMRSGVELEACLACFCSKLYREAAYAGAHLFCLGCIVRVSFSVSILLVSPKLVFIMLIPDLFLYDPSVRLRLPHTSCGRPAVCWNSGFSVLQVLFV